MDTAIKVAAAAICAVSLYLVIKKDSAPFIPMIAIASVIVISSMVVAPVREIINTITDIAETAKINGSVLAIVLKTLGITIVCRFASEICREGGLSSAANCVEFAGRILAAFTTLPLIRTFMETIINMV